jgi:hypothetical protein
MKKFPCHPHVNQRQPPEIKIAVSVIIPFYGVEAYIGACIESVLQQSMSEFELILVDDASLDNSRLIAEIYVRNDPRVQIIAHESNKGLGAARNTGVQVATGDYIFFLDSDDLLTDQFALSVLLDRARSTACKVIVGSCQRLRADGARVAHDRMMDHSHNGSPGLLLGGVSPFLAALGVPGEPYIPLRAWGILIERKFYLTCGLTFPPGEHEDMPVIPFLYHQVSRIFYDLRVVVDYRERAGTLSNGSWSTAKLLRYGVLWAEMRQRMWHFDMHTLVGDAAAAFACHLIYRMASTTLDEEASKVSRDVLGTIISDLGGATNRSQIMILLARISEAPWFSTRDFGFFDRLTSVVPLEVMIAFYKQRLDLHQCDGQILSGEHIIGPGATDTALRIPSQQEPVKRLLFLCECYRDALDHVEALARESKARTREVEQMYLQVVNSRSWKMTAPLREVLKRVIQIMGRTGIP